MTTTIGSLDLNAFSDLYSDLTQYFWFESNASATYGAGAHVTLVPDTSFISNPTGQNILMNTDGFSIRNGLLPMMTLSNNSLDFNVVDTTTGTYTNVASFGASSTIGVTNGTQSYMALDYHSLRMIDKEGDYYLYISDRRGENGSATLEVNFLGNGETTQFDVGVRINTLDSAVDSSDPSNVATVSTTNSRYVDFSTAPANGAQVTIVFTTTDQGAKAYTFGTRDTTNDVLGASSVVLNRLNVASGPDSCASGYYTVASGNNAHSEGLHTTASGNNAHSEGYYTTASGSGSHAEGTTLLLNTDDTRTYTTSSGIGSHAEGAGTTASNQASHAEGSGTTSSGHSSHAEGYLTIASGHSSHAEGYRTKASGQYSHAEGSGTTASGSGSHAEGTTLLLNTDDTRTYTTSSGIGSHAEGAGTTASNQASHAEGSGTTSSGHSSHAEGYLTIASGDSSHAEGGTLLHDDDTRTYTTASGRNAHAEGAGTTASGNSSHAEGIGTIASGYNSHAEGGRTTASGEYSHAQNRYTVATENFQTVIGKYNAATVTGSGTDADPYVYSDVGDYAFIIGNGTDNPTANRSNALTVDWDGNVEAAGGVAIRKSATAQKDLTYVNEYVRLSANQTASESAGQLTLSTSNKNCLVANKYDEIWSDYMNECVSVTNGVVTILKSGRYRFDYQVYFYNGFTANDIPTCGIGLNGLNGALLRASRFKATVTNPYTTLSGSYTGWGEKGSTFYLIAQNSTGARGVVGLSQYTRLVVTCLMTH